MDIQEYVLVINNFYAGKRHATSVLMDGKSDRKELEKQFARECEKGNVKSASHIYFKLDRRLDLAHREELFYVALKHNLIPLTEEIFIDLRDTVLINLPEYGIVEGWIELVQEFIKKNPKKKGIASLRKTTISSLAIIKDWKVC